MDGTDWEGLFCISLRCFIPQDGLDIYFLTTKASAIMHTFHYHVLYSTQFLHVRWLKLVRASILFWGTTLTVKILILVYCGGMKIVQQTLSLSFQQATLCQNIPQFNCNREMIKMSLLLTTLAPLMGLLYTRGVTLITHQDN